MKKAAAFLFFFLSVISAQQFSLKGIVSDSEFGGQLEYANLRIQNSYRGTSANSQGEFEFKLEAGKYNLITSYIGYISDTTEIVLDQNKFIEIQLSPVTINLSEVTVFPGENPALQIIKKATERKNKRKEFLKDYSFTAYTKTIVKTTNDISQKKSSEFSVTKLDTGQLKITAIMENESKGYFKFPDYYKDIIIARKQSENLPPAANIIAGGRILVDFYNETIDLVQDPLVGPIADNAIDYYYYIITDTLAIDNQSVFKINFEPIDEYDPGLVGDLYIKDKTFDLIKVVTGITESANPMGLFDSLVVNQQYTNFDNKVYLPTDYRLIIEGNLLGIAKFGFQLSSIFNNYEINTGISDDFFDLAMVTVKPDADKKDSLYWHNIQAIPTTEDEDSAYARIDSLESQKVNFWDNFSFLSSKVTLSENVRITGPLDLYGFNKVEGHILKYGVSLNNALDRRLDLNADASYGFNDKKFKKSVWARYYLGEYRTHSISVSAYDKVNSLFMESDKYGDFLSVLLNLMTKYDFKDYYYSKGFEFDLSSEVFPFLNLDLGYMYREDLSAVNNSDFSIFYPSRHYNDNKQILPATINAFKTGFKLDFRKYIENGYNRVRMDDGEDYTILSGNVILSNDWLGESDYNFEIYKLNLYGKIRTLRAAELRFNVQGVISNGAVPYQYMYALPGNLNGLGQQFTFRTLDIGEVFGDRVVTIGLEQDFKDELFRSLNFPLLREWGVTFGLHANMAWVNMTENSQAIIPVTFTTYDHPLYELGFSIGQRDFPITLEFTWKLNHLVENNFTWGVGVFEM